MLGTFLTQVSNTDQCKTSTEWLPSSNGQYWHKHTNTHTHTHTHTSRRDRRQRLPIFVWDERGGRKDAKDGQQQQQQQQQQQLEFAKK